MKFLFFISIIRILFSMLDNADKKKMTVNEIKDDVKHPAEFALRW